MIKLIYDAHNGMTLPDGKIKEWVHKYIDENQNIDVTLTIGQGFILNEFRLAVKQNKLDHNKITIHFGRWTIRVDKYGTLEYWPKGLDDYYDTLLNDMVEWPTADNQPPTEYRYAFRDKKYTLHVKDKGVNGIELAYSDTELDKSVNVPVFIQSKISIDELVEKLKKLE